MTLKQQKGFAVPSPYGPPELIHMCTGFFLFVGHVSFARSCAITGGRPAWRWRWHLDLGLSPTAYLSHHVTLNEILTPSCLSSHRGVVAALQAQVRMRCAEGPGHSGR